MQRASKLWQDLGDALNTASTQKQLGLVLWQQGKLEESQISLEQARQYFEQIGYPYDVAQVTGNLGNIHATQGDWAQAEQHYLHALKLLDEVNAPFDKIGILNNLGGLALLRRENLEEATFFYEESLALARDLGNQPGIRDALLNLAVVNLHRHQWDVARQHYVEALAVAQTQKHGRMIWHIRYRLLRFSILYTLLRGVAWLRYSLTGRSEGDVQDRL